MAKSLKRIDTQIAFLGALIFAFSLDMYSAFGYKDLIINKKKSRFTTKKLYQISVLTSNIILIVAIYFFLDTYEDYKEKQDKASFIFYTAAILSVIAQSIRVSTIIKYPSDIQGEEDIA